MLLKNLLRENYQKMILNLLKFNYDINPKKALKNISSFMKKDKVYLLSKYLENSNFELFTNLIYSYIFVIQKKALLRLQNLSRRN